MNKRIRKLEDKAQGHLEWQRYEKALEVFQEIAGLDPDNPRWLHKLGEAYNRLGRAAEAIAAYDQAARLNVEQGQLLKAIAQCRMVLDLDPGHTEVQGMLASLYAQRRSAAVLSPRSPTTGAPVAAPWEEQGAAAGETPATTSLDESPELPSVDDAGDAPPRSAAAELREEVPSTTGVGRLSDEQLPAGSKVEESEWVIPDPRDGADDEYERPEAISLVLQAPADLDGDGDDFGGEEVQVLYDPGLRDISGEIPDWTSRSLSSMSSTPEMGKGDTLDSIELRKLMEELEGEISEDGDSVVLEIDLDGEEEYSEDEHGEEAGVVPSTATQILAQMPAVPLFSSLDEGALLMIIERVVVRTFDKGDRIVRQGSPGDSLFVIVEGQVHVYREGAPRVDLATLGEGAFFGEVAVVTEQERAATVEALTAGYALEITRDLIGKVVSRYPDVLKQLLRFFRMRMIDLLVETHELFRPFAAEDRRQLEKRFSFLEATEGSRLLTEGEHGDGLYILVSGHAEAQREGNWLGELQAGDMVGEPSLLTGRPSAVTVVASSKCWLLRLDRAFFQDHVMKHPEVLRIVGKLAEDRRAQQETVEKGEGFERFSLTLY